MIATLIDQREGGQSTCIYWIATDWRIPKVLAGHPLRFSCDAKPVWFGYALILTCISCMNHQLRCFNTNDMMKFVTHFVPILGQFSVIAIACLSCLEPCPECHSRQLQEMQARHSRVLDRGERRGQMLKLFGGKQMFEQISYLLQWQFTLHQSSSHQWLFFTGDLDRIEEAAGRRKPREGKSEWRSGWGRS